jgi:hypothetical protein
VQQQLRRRNDGAKRSGAIGVGLVRGICQRIWQRSGRSTVGDVHPEADQ